MCLYCSLFCFILHYFVSFRLVAILAARQTTGLYYCFLLIHMPLRKMSIYCVTFGYSINYHSASILRHVLHMWKQETWVIYGTQSCGCCMKFDVLKTYGLEHLMWLIFEKIHLYFETIPDRILGYSRETGNYIETSLLIAFEIPA